MKGTVAHRSKPFSPVQCSQDSPMSSLPCLRRSMISLIVLGISCVSEPPIWHGLPPTVTSHQWIMFILPPISLASVFTLNRCSFGLHVSGTPTTVPHSRMLFCHLLPWIYYPVLPTHTPSPGSSLNMSFRDWFALLSLSIWWLLDGLVPLLIQMHSEGRREFQTSDSSLYVLQAHSCWLCAIAHNC